MTKVNFVKKAAKAYPRAGIEKGDSYYWWQHFRQPKQMSKIKPQPSQVASSEYAQDVLALVEGLESWEGEWLEDDRDTLVADLEEIRDREQDKFDNLPEGFQQGDIGMMLEDHVSALDEWVGELQGIEFEEQEEGAQTPLEYALEYAVQP